MKMRMMTLTAATVATLAASSAFADPYKHGPRYRPAPPAPEYDYARVVDVDPIVRRVRVERPVQECWDETQYSESRPHISDPQVGGRTLLGAVIGGVIGHQFGSGRGRDAATVAGAVIGSKVGYDAGARRVGSSGTDTRTVQRCETRYEEQYEERVEAYDVEYVYNGRRYHTQLPYDPGERVRIRVDVSPA